MNAVRILTLVFVILLPLAAGDVPRAAPDITVKTSAGQTLSLAQLRGKVVLMMFFSTDCPHCQTTTRLLAPIYDELKPRGFEIVGVAINPSAAGNLDSFAKNFGAKFPLALGTRADSTKFAEISVMARFYVPYLFFVDRNGNIREEHEGGDRKFFGDEASNIRAAVEALL
jgi:peroxiredoxin